ncbi:MAG: hypothetical protein IJX77_00445 [Ruminococcus sp.]|nr:hypothetical protein [Ruminococcus sp.]
MNDISYKVALGGIVSALCLVTMFLSGIIPALYLVLPMIAGVLMMIIAVEVNTRWALLTYIAVSLLSMFITFDKEAALIFALFFGHYPILRFYIEKIRIRPAKVILKFIIFNVCIIAFFYITVYMFGLDQMLDEMNEFGKYGALIMLAAVNLVFVLYDYNLEICYMLYRKKIMPKFRRKKH